MTTFFKLATSLLLIGGLSVGTSLPTQAQQRRTVKEANKINEKRNDIKEDYSRFSEDQLDYDSEFVVAAASSNMLEIALGQLAQQKAIATEVRDWGRQMEYAHSTAEQNLRDIAYRAHITLPGLLNKDARDVYDDVDDRKYLGFDKKYLRTLKDLHERDLKMYAEAAAKLANPDLQQYAARMLPQLRQHEMTIKQLYERADERK